MNKLSIHFFSIKFIQPKRWTKEGKILQNYVCSNNTFADKRSFLFLVALNIYFAVSHLLILLLEQFEMIVRSLLIGMVKNKKNCFISSTFSDTKYHVIQLTWKIKVPHIFYTLYQITCTNYRLDKACAHGAYCKYS